MCLLTCFACLSLLLKICILKYDKDWPRVLSKSARSDDDVQEHDIWNQPTLTINSFFMCSVAQSNVIITYVTKGAKQPSDK
jgi:hypothetical protein